MAFPERVAQYLKTRRGKAYCDDCLTAALRLDALSARYMAHHVTHVLGETEEFHRTHGQCSNCGQIDQGH